MDTPIIYGKDTTTGEIKMLNTVGGVLLQTNGSLNDLTDVVINTPALGQLLYYNGTNWVNLSLALDNLSDVVIDNPLIYQLLYYDGTKWINSPFRIDILNPQFNNVLTYNGTTWVNQPAQYISLLSGLSDVNIVSPNLNEVLRYDTTILKWKNTLLNLDYLDDVEISNPMNNQILYYNGTKWINKPISKDYLSIVLYGVSKISLYTSNTTEKYILTLFNNTYWNTDPTFNSGTNNNYYVNFNGLLYTVGGSTSLGRIVSLNQSKIYKVELTINLNLGISAAVTWECGIRYYNGTNYVDFNPALVCRATQRTSNYPLTMTLSGYITGQTIISVYNKTLSSITVTYGNTNIDTQVNLSILEI